MSSPSDAPARWWHGRTPSLVIFVVVVALAGMATLAMTREVAEVLPEVGRDQLGDDRWEDPVGVELVDGLQIGHVPDCASGSVTRIVLWDADSEPLWEVEGPPTALQSFFIGMTPQEFTEVVPYREPPADELVRLVVFHRSGAVAGLRYDGISLREDRVMSGNPLRRFTVEGFLTARICGRPDGAITPEDGVEPIPELTPVDPDPDGPDVIDPPETSGPG
jgi:hypothetical protein